MSRRIEIELTSARPDGSWTWRVAGAKQPRGVVEGSVLPEDAKVGDVLRADADFELDGTVITAVIKPPPKRQEVERLPLLADDRPFEGVTTSLVPKGGRPRRDRDDRGPRPERTGGDRRGGPGDFATGGRGGPGGGRGGPGGGRGDGPGRYDRGPAGGGRVDRPAAGRPPADGAGTDGTGTDGTGTDGAGTDGTGTDGVGTDGAGGRPTAGDLPGADRSTIDRSTIDRTSDRSTPGGGRPSRPGGLRPQHGDRAAARHGGARPGERLGAVRRPGAGEGRPPAGPPRPRRLNPGSAHRAAVLSSLAPEERAVAEQVLLGGVPGVRRAMQEQNARAREEGRPEVKADALVALAEELLPRLKAAEWRDRAEAAVKEVDELNLRDLRSVIAGADGGARDDDSRILAKTLREALDRREAAERQAWLDEVTGHLDEDRLTRALRVAGRPPDPRTRFPVELTTRLADAASAALGPGTPPDRWGVILAAVLESPVRRSVKPAGLPPAPGEALLTAARQASGRIPALAAMLGLTMPPPPGPPRAGMRPVPSEGRPPSPPRAPGATSRAAAGAPAGTSPPAPPSAPAAANTAPPAPGAVAPGPVSPDVPAPVPPSAPAADAQPAPAVQAGPLGDRPAGGQGESAPIEGTDTGDRLPIAPAAPAALTQAPDTATLEPADDEPQPGRP